MIAQSVAVGVALSAAKYGALRSGSRAGSVGAFNADQCTETLALHRPPHAGSELSGGVCTELHGLKLFPTRARAAPERRWSFLRL